jgi:hypothetical protein
MGCVSLVGLHYNTRTKELEIPGCRLVAGLCFLHIGDRISEGSGIYNTPLGLYVSYFKAELRIRHQFPQHRESFFEYCPFSSVSCTQLHVLSPREGPLYNELSATPRLSHPTPASGQKKFGNAHWISFLVSTSTDGGKSYGDCPDYSTQPAVRRVKFFTVHL